MLPEEELLRELPEETFPEERVEEPPLLRTVPAEEVLRWTERTPERETPAPEADEPETELPDAEALLRTVVPERAPLRRT